MTPDPWRPAPGSATGVGSLPGTDPREAAAEVTGELPDLPHLPELPGRGIGADMVGRTAALLRDLHVDAQPSGWRLVDRPGMDERRARAYVGQDLDELEAHAQGFVGPVKLQVTGPWTLAAALALPRGEPVLSDKGALREVFESLTEGLIAHVADLRSRLPGAEPVVQLDEPSLPAVLTGAVRSSSGARTFQAVRETVAEDVLRDLVDALGGAGRRALLRGPPAGRPGPPVGRRGRLGRPDAWSATRWTTSSARWSSPAWCCSPAWCRPYRPAPHGCPTSRLPSSRCGGSGNGSGSPSSGWSSRSSSRRPAAWPAPHRRTPGPR